MAKSIADKIDMGAILLNTTEDDLLALEKVINNGGFDQPNVKMSIYKNRRGRYKGILLWCKADLGKCRIQPMFCTSYDYDMIGIDDVRIMIDQDELESAF